MLARLHLLERSSYYCILIAGLLLIAGRQPSLAQVFDDFEDGDFTSAPAWVGTTDRWQIVDVDGTRMANSTARPSADTLHLATRSETAYGSWEFRFSRSGVNLSNFNGTRVFLVADVPNLAGNVRGYFLQLGTNNAKDIRLVRIDGDPSSRRVEIGRSEAGIAEGDTADVRFRVERDELSRWTVFADDELIIQAEDDRYQASNWFGFWVKHTSTTGSGYFFEDVGVTPGATPAPPSTEATPQRPRPNAYACNFLSRFWRVPRVCLFTLRSRHPLQFTLSCVTQATSSIAWNYTSTAAWTCADTTSRLTALCMRSASPYDRFTYRSM